MEAGPPTDPIRPAEKGGEAGQGGPRIREHPAHHGNRVVGQQGVGMQHAAVDPRPRWRGDRMSGWPGLKAGCPMMSDNPAAESGCLIECATSRRPSAMMVKA